MRCSEVINCSLGNVPCCLLITSKPRMANANGHFVGHSFGILCLWKPPVLWTPGWCGVAGTCHPSLEMQISPRGEPAGSPAVPNRPAGEHPNKVFMSGRDSHDSRSFTPFHLIHNPVSIGPLAPILTINNNTFYFKVLLILISKATPRI